MFNKLKTALKKKTKKEDKSGDVSPSIKIVKVPELPKDFKAEEFMKKLFNALFQDGSFKIKESYIYKQNYILNSICNEFWWLI